MSHLGRRWCPFGATTVGEVIAWLQRRSLAALQSVEVLLGTDGEETRLIGHPALYAQSLELLVVTMTHEAGVSLKLRLLDDGISDADGDYRFFELRPSDSERWSIDAKVMTAVRMLLKPYACPLQVDSECVRRTPRDATKSSDSELASLRGDDAEPPK